VKENESSTSERVGVCVETRIGDKLPMGTECPVGLLGAGSMNTGGGILLDGGGAAPFPFHVLLFAVFLVYLFFFKVLRLRNAIYIKYRL